LKDSNLSNDSKESKEIITNANVINSQNFEEKKTEEK